MLSCFSSSGVKMKRSAENKIITPSKSPKLSSADSNCNRMRVCVRVRPLNAKELEAGAKSIIDVIDNNLLVFDPFVYDEANDQYQYHGKTYKEIGKKANKNLQFSFDRVFGVNDDNLTVYQETTKDFVNSLLNGYNCSVFAYGSTGSGKTHTMLGSKNNPGVIFFTTMDLYEQIEKEADKNLEVSVSYFEIYNEVIYDLLDPTSGKPLSVLEDSNKGMTIKNLSIHQPRDADHLLEMLEFGNKNRKQHPTDSNAESSRSHAIFQLSLRRKDFSNEQEMTIQVSKMSLIDLAGSERANVAYKTYRSNGLSREGGNINKSLLSLGNCISALANNANNNKSGYIPYRSSKLTLILRDSLGGNCQTLMVATVSLSASQYEEIHNTLLYAERAKGVQLSVRKNNISVGVQPRDYKHMFEKMNQEKSIFLEQIESLKEEIEKYKSKSIPANPVCSSSEAVQLLNSVKSRLDELFAERLELRKKLLDYEHNLKLLDLRLLFRNYDTERAKLLENIENCDELIELKSNDSVHSIYSQKLHYSNLKSCLEKKIQLNEADIAKYEMELLEKSNNDIVVRSYFVENNSLTQSKDVDQLQKHIVDVAKKVIEKNNSNQEFSVDLIAFANKAYHVLNGLGHLSEDMEAKFKSMIQKMNGKKSVVWRDNVDSPKINKVNEIVDMFRLDLYMATNATPSHKRNLVAVRDITPTYNSVQSRTPFKNNSNVPSHNLGNTVTKSRSVAVISPGFTIKIEKENNNQQFRYKSPQSHRLQPGNQWSKPFYNTRNRPNFRFNYNNPNYSNPPSSNTRRNNRYDPYKSSNPNYRPKFRF